MAHFTCCLVDNILYIYYQKFGYGGGVNIPPPYPILMACSLQNGSM